MRLGRKDLKSESGGPRTGCSLLLREVGATEEVFSKLFKLWDW